MPPKRELTREQKRILERREIQRNNMRQKRGRKKGGSLILLYLMLSFLLVAALITLSLTVFFKIETIEIVGESIYSNQEVVMTSGIKKEQNLISIDKRETADRIISALPYIDEVRIQRALPSKLVIEISPADEAYVFLSAGENLYTSSSLRILNKNSDDIENIIRVAGFDLKNSIIGEKLAFKDDAQKELFNLVNKRIESGDIKGITHIFMDDAGELNLVYEGRVIWIVGSGNDFDKKIKFAYTVCTDPEKMAANFTGTLDLSDYHPKTPSIRSRARNISDTLSGVFQALT